MIDARKPPLPIRTAFCVAALLLASTPCAISRADEPTPLRVRKWTDASGAFTLKASLVDCEEDVVRLKTADDREITIPLDRLSGVDQRYVRATLRRRPSVENSSSRAPADQAPAQGEATNNEAGEQHLGARVPSRAKRLYGVDWHGGPEDALEVARVTNDKPVLWFRVLGDLEGFM